MSTTRAIMPTYRVRGWMALLLVAGCGGFPMVMIQDPEPGAFLPEGGEVRHENVRYLGQPVQTWVMVYQYTASSAVPTAPFPLPDMGGRARFGACVDERPGSPTWPFAPIVGTTYLLLPKVTLSGPGITGALDIARTDPPNTTGNSTFRSYDFTYGGGAPGAPPGGFNGTMTEAMSTPGGNYTLDIGKAAPMTYHMPDAYIAPLGIGGAATVTIPAHQDLELTWAAPPNDMGASGTMRTRTTYFNFTLFIDPGAANPPQFICFPDVDGHQLIPASVIDALPAAGLVFHADYSHYMDTREAAPGEQRRFDLVSAFNNVSRYAKQ